MTAKKPPTNNERRSHENVWKEGVDSDLHFVREGHIELKKEVAATKKEVAETKALVKENTEITKAMGNDIAAVGKKLDVLVEDTDPLVRGTKAFRKVGTRVGILGRLGERTADRLMKLGKIGLMVLGLWYFGTAVWHGTGLGVAWHDFIRFITK